MSDAMEEAHRRARKIVADRRHERRAEGKGRDIPVLQDMDMPLSELSMIIADLFTCYGPDAHLRADAGWNNVSFEVRFPDED